MNAADGIALALLVIFAILGIVLGFSRWIKFFCKGLIFGTIFSIIVCYFIFGWVSGWGFIQNSFMKISSMNWLNYTILAIVLFIVVSLIRWLVVKLLSGIFESKNIVCRVLNKTLGFIFWVATIIALVLIVFQIIYWIGGSTAESFYNWLDGGFMRLEWLFDHNPVAGFLS
ncbi:MAG: hypothetical protein LUD47_02245 [Clostridia bacterium]|nr:hypothetical protein [Clostridia bacterium]